MSDEGDDQGSGIVGRSPRRATASATAVGSGTHWSTGTTAAGHGGSDGVDVVRPDEDAAGW